jgi:lysophospholipase L1-like esterase
MSLTLRRNFLALAVYGLVAAGGGLLLCGQSQPPAAPATQASFFKFSFGATPLPGFAQVPVSARYNDEAGYGFENIGGAFPDLVPARTNAPEDSGYITAQAPFFFSVKLPEGNYRVTVHLGSTAEGTTTVKAELRRLMLEQIHTNAGELVSKTFAVNVHKPPILDASGKQVGAVRVSGREVAGRGGSAGANIGKGAYPNLNRIQGGEGWSWDDTLTLEFSGTPVVRAIEIQRDDSIHNIFIAGDSTVCDQPAEPFTSWGQVITRWIKPDYAVSNYAISGNTAAAFYAAQRMAKIVSQLRPGDFVFVQYGHNDMKSTAPDALASYKNFYKRFVADTRAKGTTPVILTPVSRETFDKNGKITNSFLTARGDDFPKAVREVAEEDHVLLIDLQSISAQFYEALGPGKSQVAFANANEKTHHSDYGSYEIAKCVMQGIIDLKLPIAQSAVDDWKPFDPTKPDLFADFKLPPDPMPGRTATPDGN